MKKSKAVLILLWMCIIASFLFPPVVHSKTSGPTIVSTGVTFETDMPNYSHKSLHGDGYFWVFYWNLSHYLLYRSSNDGITWGSPQTVSGTDYDGSGIWHWRDFDLYYDGSVIHLVLCKYNSTSPNYWMYYSQGNLSTGTISWSIFYYICNTAVKPSVIVDTNNCPWVSYSNGSSPAGFFARKAGSTSGDSWGSAMELFAVSGIAGGCLARQSNGNVMYVYNGADCTLYSKLYNSTMTTWESPLTIGSATDYNFWHGFDICVDDNWNVHLVNYRNAVDFKNIAYALYNSTILAWSSFSDITPPHRSGDPFDTLGGLTIDSSSQELYLWYCYATTSICYARRVNGTWQSSVLTWERSNAGNLGVYANVSGSYAGLTWAESSSLMHGIINDHMSADLNVNGKVDIQDIALVAIAYGTKPGDARWNPAADLDKNGQIDRMDVVLAVADYGKTT